MDIRRALVILAAGIVAASCSEKSAPERAKNSEAKREPDSAVAKDEEESQPGDEEIAEHCVAFVRSTKVVSAQTPNADCPGCPPAGREALAFRQMKVDRISCSGEACTVLVTLRVSFNPGAGERLGRWIDGLDFARATKRLFERADAPERTDISRSDHLPASRRNVAGGRIRSGAGRMSARRREDDDPLSDLR